jgi:large subunit ribosomal protein L21
MKKEENKNIPFVPLKEGSVVALERYAVIQTGGKQYFAVEGKTLAIEKIDGVEGDEIFFDEVLLRRINAQECQIGQPFLDGAVKATIVKQMRGKKIIVFKFKRRKKYRKKQGHRQLHTIVRIISI